MEKSRNEAIDKMFGRGDKGDVGRVPPTMQEYLGDSTEELEFARSTNVGELNSGNVQLAGDDILDDFNDETFNTGPVGDDWQMSTDLAALIEKEKEGIKGTITGGRAQGTEDDNEVPIVLNDIVRVTNNADDDDDDDDEEIFLPHKGPIETEDDEDEDKIVSKFSKLFSTAPDADPSKPLQSQRPQGPDAAWNVAIGPAGGPAQRPVPFGMFAAAPQPQPHLQQLHLQPQPQPQQGQPQVGVPDPISRLFAGQAPPSPHKLPVPQSMPVMGMTAMFGGGPGGMPRTGNRVMSVEELEARLTNAPAPAPTPTPAQGPAPAPTQGLAQGPAPQMPMSQHPIPGTPAQFMFPHLANLPPAQQLQFAAFLAANPQLKGFLPPGMPLMQGQLGPGGLPFGMAGMMPPVAPQHAPSPQKPQILNNPQGHHGQRDFQEQRQMHLANQKALSAKLGPKKMMTPAEIEMIISQHHQQITTSPSPYMDDYYYLCWSRKNGEAGGTVDNHARIQALNHHPICLSTPPRAAKKQVHNPEGVLGRIPTHSVRSPRVLLQLKNDKASVNTGEEDVNNGAVYAMHLVLHRIEDAFNWLLDLEDLALLAKNLPPHAENLTFALPGANPQNPNDTTINFGQKKRELARELFRTLGVFMVPSIDIDADNVDIDPNSRYFPENFSVSGESKCNFEEDELFVCIFFSSKGKKLLSRAMKFFSTTQLFWITLVFLRNLSLVVSNPASSAEDLKLSSLVFDELCAGVSKFGLSQLTKCLNSIVSFQTDFIGSLLKQTGIQLVSAVLKRALQLLTVHNMAMWQGLSQSHAIWKESFDLFYEQLAGQFGTLLVPPKSTPIPDGSAYIPTALATQTQVFEFLLLMALQESEAQKKAMFAEIVPLFQSIDTSDPFVQRFIQISTQS